MKAKPKLIKTLSDVQKYLRSFKNINEGGCGIAALAMYRWILKNKPCLNVAFIMVYHDSHRFKQNSDNIAYSYEHYEIPTAPSHAGIVTNKLSNVGRKMQETVTIDCDGFINVLEYGYSHTFGSPYIMVDAINNFDSWNDNFHRRNNVKNIAKRLDIDLSDIKIIRSK